MRFQILLLAVFTSLLFLAACGGDNNNPYDGTWMAVYPFDYNSVITTGTQTITCDTTPGTIIIKDNIGTTQQSTLCTITNLATSSVPATSYNQGYFDIISVSIGRSDAPGGNDVLNAIVNGVTFIGQCISTLACSASSGTKTLSLTR